MNNLYKFHTETPLAKGMVELLRKLKAETNLTKPIKMFLAGGMAVHLYVGSRVTTDVDAEFGSRIFIPNDLAVAVQLEDGSQKFLYIDTNFNSSFALMHENYLDDAVPVEFGVENILACFIKRANHPHA